MRIVLKPLGALIVVGTLIGLVVLIFLPSLKTPKSPATVAPVAMASVAAPSPAASVAATVSGSTIADGRLYDDTLQNGWANYSWAKVDLAEAKQAAPQGKSCIRVKPGAFEALAFHHTPTSLAGYDRVQFQINGGNTGKQSVRALLVLTETKAGKATDASQPEVVLPPLTKNQWQKVTLSLRRLNGEGKNNVSGLWIMENMGNKDTPPFYIDDVHLLKTGASE